MNAIAILGLVALGTLILWSIAQRRNSIRRSIRLLRRTLGGRRTLSLDSLHAYVYGRWTNRYISVLLNWIFPYINPGQRLKWSEHYHGKVLTYDNAKAIITIDKKIPLRDLEQIVPYSKARDIVLSAPTDIVVFECACRNAREKPCQPVQVCMVIGKPFTEFILKHHPGTSRRLSQAEALDLLREEHERGHIHSAWFKDVLMNRFYAICNCCKCCCGGVEAMVKYSTPMMASSGYVAQIDRERCSNCQVCVDVCPFGALSYTGEIQIDWGNCMGCGVCESQCSLEAVTLIRDERKGIPLDVRMLVREGTSS
jgi:ferredoxin